MTGRCRSTCDSLYQLVREDYSRNHGFEQFAYDASGNRRSYDSSIPGYPTIPETATAYSNADEMLACGQYASFTYDNEGNQRTKTTNGQTTTYTGDYRNRLLGITHPDTSVSTMQYDFAGSRIRQTTKTGETTKYYWDNAYVLVETDENGNIRAINTIGNEIISREYRANPGDPNCVREKYYYLYDHLGNTRALTDGQGNIVQEYFYDVYGKCWNVTKDSINGTSTSAVTT